MAYDALETARSAKAGPRLLPALVHALARLAAWREKARSRERLARLPPELLRDVGLTPEAARDEAARPFWE